MATSNRKQSSVLVLCALVCLSVLTIGAQERGRGASPQGQQAPAGRGRAAGPGYLKLFDSNLPFEPRDLAGIWTPNGNGFGGGGRCRDCGDRGYSFEFPEFTPAGQAAFDKNIPVIRPHEGQRRRQGASGRAHRTAARAAAGARQRYLRHVQPDGHAARDPLSRSGGVHRPAGSHLSAFPVGLRAADDLDGRPKAPGARRRRSGAVVGIRRRHAGKGTRWSSTPPATTSARGSTTSAIRTAIRWCCTRNTRASTTTRSS